MSKNIIYILIHSIFLSIVLGFIITNKIVNVANANPATSTNITNIAEIIDINITETESNVEIIV
ncbi:MAG: hypothetical protein AAF195_04225, partial [Pseudomonadota bacterium]